MISTKDLVKKLKLLRKPGDGFKVSDATERRRAMEQAQTLMNWGILENITSRQNDDGTFTIFKAP